jgi:selenocysteine-specific elongation factor
MARMIGTAGHVDHGKTTLIQALTGIDADRLPEEKARGMTIDVGFAYLDFPDHGRVSIVDVPGHEKFIHNMLVGALGVDVALLCVSADEGVMPQTREHVEILGLLPVNHLVVALTRADLADSDMRALAREDVRDLLKETRFADAPIIEVSALTREGLDALIAEISRALSSATGSERAGPWYLPIDRAFAVKGHGVVVTGTLAQGKVSVGESAVLEPGGQSVRVRSLHSHAQGYESLESGRRVAMNLGGIRIEDIHRGQAVGAAGALFATDRIDAEVTWIRPAKHGMRVRVSIGAAEAMGKLFLNDHDPNWVQLVLDEHVAAALHQPLVVRRASPMEVLCGGRVRVPLATRRKRSQAPPKVTASDRPSAIRELVGDDPNGLTTEEIARSLGASLVDLGDDFEALRKAGTLRGFAGRWISETGYRTLIDLLRAALREIHDKHPTQSMHPRERVFDLAKLRWGSKPLDRLIATLAADGIVVAEGTNIRDADFRLELSAKQRQFLDRVKEALDAAGANVPAPHEITRTLSVPPQAVDEILRLGVESRELVRVGDGIFYTTEGLTKLMDRLRSEFAGRAFEASEVRDLFGSSRKYVIPLLEYLDARSFTQRTGDRRMIR